jgi:hypothetical protein
MSESVGHNDQVFCFAVWPVCQCVSWRQVQENVKFKFDSPEGNFQCLTPGLIIAKPWPESFADPGMRTVTVRCMRCVGGVCIGCGVSRASGAKPLQLVAAQCNLPRRLDTFLPSTAVTLA